MEAKRFPARKHRGRDGKGWIYRESECRVTFEVGERKWMGRAGCLNRSGLWNSKIRDRA